MNLPGTPKSRCILLVDDDPFIIAVYVAKLKKAGMDVESVTDGTEALHRLESFRPDMVILDLNMPKLNGIEVLKYIRNSPALESLPVLVLTNVCSDSIMRETWEARPTRYLIKRETPPNVVVEEVLSLLTAPVRPLAEAPSASAETVEADAARLDPQAAVRLSALRSARTADSIRDALVQFRQCIEPQLMACRQHPPGAFLLLFVEAMDTLFEDLYAHPESATPSLFRAVDMCFERLQQIFSERGIVTGGAVEVATVLVVSEDDYLRETVGRILHRPFLRPIRVGDIGVALHLMRENVFRALVLDAHPEEEYLKRFRDLPGGDKIPVVVLTPQQHYRPTQKAGFERVAKPVDPADIAIKLLLLL